MFVCELSGCGFESRCNCYKSSILFEIGKRCNPVIANRKGGLLQHWKAILKFSENWWNQPCPQIEKTLLFTYNDVIKYDFYGFIGQLVKRKQSSWNNLADNVWLAFKIASVIAAKLNSKRVLLWLTLHQPLNQSGGPSRIYFSNYN